MYVYIVHTFRYISVWHLPFRDVWLQCWEFLILCLICRVLSAACVQHMWCILFRLVPVVVCHCFHVLIYFLSYCCLGYVALWLPTVLAHMIFFSCACAHGTHCASSYVRCIRPNVYAHTHIARAWHGHVVSAFSRCGPVYFGMPTHTHAEYHMHT